MKISNCCGIVVSKEYAGFCPMCARPCNFIPKEDVNKELKDDEHPELNVSEG